MSEATASEFGERLRNGVRKPIASLVQPPAVSAPVSPVFTVGADVPVACVVRLDTFFIKNRSGAAWDLTPLSKQGAERILADRDLVPPPSEWPKTKNGGVVGPLHDYPNVPLLCTYAHGLECKANAPPLVLIDDEVFVNTWSPPKLKPAPGDFSRVRRVVEWLVKDDAKAVDYIFNWCAFKIQNPDLMPQSAILFQGTQGNGKNTFYRILAAMLGEENCAVIDENDIARPFNTHYALKLLVLANELVDTHRSEVSVNDKLKPLITDSKVWLETKGLTRLPATNRCAFLAATNKDKPIELEEHDRRWSVFERFTPVNSDDHARNGQTHKDFLASLHVPGKNDVFTTDFEKEISGFFHYLLGLKVEHSRVSTPYNNQTRRDLTALSESAQRSFLRELKEAGGPEQARAVLDYLWKRADSGSRETPQLFNSTRTAITSAGLYACLREYCRGIGQNQVPAQKALITELKRQGWTPTRAALVRCWRPPFQVGDLKPEENDAR